MSRSVYLELVSGAGGDMILASLLGLGADLSLLNEQFGKLCIEGLIVDLELVKRHGIQCNHLKLNLPHQHEYRHIHQLLQIIHRGGFSPSVNARCEAVLDRLAQAEATVHGISKEKVHFHEIGALDTIIDILGTCLVLEQLGIDTVEFSTITDGQGTVKTEHGVMPVPVPATAELIKGLTFRSLPVASELLTPTAAALLVTLGKQNTSGVAGTIASTSYSCGDKEFHDHPNILRALLFEKREVEGADRVCLLETDMDHISGEVLGQVSSLLLEKGALDVSYSPVFMKKGRPGYRLTLLCEPSRKDEFSEMIIHHTRTLGIRWQLVDRVVADRSSVQVPFMGEMLNEKHCSFKGYSFSKAEFEDINRLSRKSGIPVLELIENYIKQQKSKEEHL